MTTRDQLVVFLLEGNFRVLAHFFVVFFEQILYKIKQKEDREYPIDFLKIDAA